MGGHYTQSWDRGGTQWAQGLSPQCMHQPYLWITVKRSSVVRDVVNTSSSSSTMESAVLSLAKLFSSVLASAELPVGREKTAVNLLCSTGNPYPWGDPTTRDLTLL